jgi:hypothetical protein
MYLLTAELAKLRIDNELRQAEQARRATRARKARARRAKREPLRPEPSTRPATQEA